MRILHVMLLSFLLFSCSRAHYCYVVRHAEKLDNTPYSVLSQAGHQRAAILRDRLLKKKITMVFATTFQRTQETAKPLADALQVPLLIYRNNAVDSIAAVIKSNNHKNILLVGHSGNIPSIVESITGQKVAAMNEQQYDKIYTIQFKKGKATVIEETY